MVDAYAAIKALVDFLVCVVLLTQSLHYQAMGLGQVVASVLNFTLINRSL